MATLFRLFILVAVAFKHSTSRNIEKAEETVLIRFHPDPETMKRSIEQNEGMPTHLPMTRTIHGKEKSTVLVLQDCLSAVTNEKTHDEEIKDYGLYKEENNDDFQVLIVERTPDGNFKVLQGLFNTEEGTYEVTPDFHEVDENKRRKRENGEISAKELQEEIEKQRNRAANITTEMKRLHLRSDTTGKSIPIDKREDNGENNNSEHEILQEEGSDKVKHTLELAMVVDFSVYKQWRDFVGWNKVMKRLRLHMSFLFHIASLPYHRLEFDSKKLRLSAVYLKVIDKRSDAIATGEILDRAVVLFDFLLYFFNSIPNADHAALFVSIPFGFSSFTYTAGACGIFSESLIFDTGSGLVGLSYAQALGISLGLTFDGVTNTCDLFQHFVMSLISNIPLTQSTVRNNYKFSFCSRNEIESFLDTQKCTLPEYTSDRPNIFEVPSSADMQGGQIVNADKQCKVFFKDRRSVWCQDVQEQQAGGLNSICLGIFCELPDSDPRNCTYITIPLEFTSCSADDDTMVCRAGLCQQDCRLLLQRCMRLEDDERDDCLEQHTRCEQNDRFKKLFLRKY